MNKDYLAFRARLRGELLTERHFKVYVKILEIMTLAKGRPLYQSQVFWLLADKRDELPYFPIDELMKLISTFEECGYIEFKPSDEFQPFSVDTAAGESKTIIYRVTDEQMDLLEVLETRGVN